MGRVRELKASDHRGGLALLLDAADALKREADATRRVFPEGSDTFEELAIVARALAIAHLSGWSIDPPVRWARTELRRKRVTRAGVTRQLLSMMEECLSGRLLAPSAEGLARGFALTVRLDVFGVDLPGSDRIEQEKRIQAAVAPAIRDDIERRGELSAADAERVVNVALRACGVPTKTVLNAIENASRAKYK